MTDLLVRPAKALAWLRYTVASSGRGIQDVLVSMIPQGMRIVTGFITSILIARGLGPVGLGQYAIVMSLAETVGQLSDLGIGQTAIRYASRATAQKNTAEQWAILRWAFRIRVWLAVLLSAALCVLAPTLADRIWHVEGLVPLIRLGLIAAFFGVLASVPIFYFQSLKRFGMNALILTGQSIAMLAGILLLAWSNRWSVSLVIAVTVITTGVGALAFLLLVPRQTLFVAHELVSMLRTGFRFFFRSPVSQQDKGESVDDTSPDKFAFFMLLSTVIVLLTLRADIWLMGYFLDESQVGLYSAGMRFTLPLTMLLTALNTALWPRASALTNVQETRALFTKTFRLSTLAAGAGLVYAVGAPLLAPLLFGAEYAGATLLGQLLCVRYCIALQFCPVGVIGYSFGMVRVYWAVNLLQLIIVVSINVMFLPSWGPLGSAVALIANDAIGDTAVGVLLWRKVRPLGGH